MTMRNVALYTAMAAYAEAVLRLLLERFNNDVPVPLIYEERWVWREDMNVFVREVQPTSLWDIYYRDALQSCVALPEYQQALDALQDDQVISPQLNVPVGIAGLQVKFPASVLLGRFVVGLIQAQGGLAPLNRKLFEQEYTAMEDAYYTHAVELRIVAPLIGLMIDTAPLELEGNFVIDALTIEEQLRFVHLGQMVTDDTVYNVPCFGVRTSFTLAKVVGELDPARANAEGRVFMNGFATFEAGMQELIRGLTAFKRGYCAWLDRSVHLDWWFTGTPRSSGSGERVATPRMNPTYRFDENEAQEFRTFWQDLRKVDVTHKNRTYIDTTLHRLRYATERERAEDRVLDLMIAAEALFLGMAGKDEKTELSFRVSLYAASFLANDREERRSVYKEMRDAYTMRSEIAHGKSVDPVKAATTADTLDSHVRKGLRRVIHLALQQPVSNNKLVEPDDLLFP